MKKKKIEENQDMVGTKSYTGSVEHNKNIS